MKPGFYWVRIGEAWTVGQVYVSARSMDGQTLSWAFIGFYDNDREPDEIGEAIPSPLAVARLR